MKSKIIISIGLLFLFFYVSCKKEKTQTYPPELETYVASFFEDARKHGRALYLNEFDLTIVFTDIDNASGTCNQKKNIIELDSYSWESKSNDRKKWLVYHELGHCILGLDHFDGIFQNGECQSIMRGSWDDNDCSTNFISPKWESYYVEEIFTGKNDLPDWYNLDITLVNPDLSSYNLFTIDTIFFDDNIRLDSIPIAKEENFQICVTYDDWLEKNTCISLSWDDKSLTLCQTGLTISQKSGFPVNSRKYYFDKSPDYLNLAESSSLCILSKNGLYHFFVGETLIHVMDFEKWEVERLITKSIDTLFSMNLEMFNFQ